MKIHKIVVNENWKSKLLDFWAEYASRDSRMSIITTVGCSKLDNAEFARLYLEVLKIIENVENNLWGEVILLVEGLVAALEKERLRRGIEVIKS